MLMSLRSTGGKWVLGILSALIMLGLVATFGIGRFASSIFNRTGNAVAFVGDVEISRNRLSREFRREMTRLRSIFGGDLDNETARNMGFVDRLVDSLVERTLYDLESERLGLAVGDDVIREAILRNPAFQNAQGVFDPNRYTLQIGEIGFSKSGFEARMRDDLKRVQLAGSVAAAATIPDVLVESLYRHREQRRVAEYFVVSNASVGPAPTPDPAQLAAYHKERAVRFTAPEYRALTFIHVSPKDLVGEVAVSEEEVAAAYDDRRAAFTPVERRIVDQILVSDEAAARAAHDKLTQGRDFVAVAGEVAGMGADEVSLGAISRGDLMEEIGDVVFQLGEGEISAPLQSPFGWHIFRVTAIDEERFPPLGEMRAEIERELAQRDAADVLFQLSNSLDDMLAGGATLEEAGDALKLDISRVAAVDADGRTPAGADADITDIPELLTAAFTTPAGETTLLGESSDGGFFIARVDGVTPSALRPLEQVRDAVAAAWSGAERDKAAAARAAAAVERVNDGESIATVAADLGYELSTTEPLRRDGDGAEPVFPRALVTALFALDVGGAGTAQAGDGSGHVVGQLADIVEADPGDDAAGVAALGEELEAEIVRDLTIQYSASLQERFPVSVNRRAIDGLF